MDPYGYNAPEEPRVREELVKFSDLNMTSQVLGKGCGRRLLMANTTVFFAGQRAPYIPLRFGTAECSPGSGMMTLVQVSFKRLRFSDGANINTRSWQRYCVILIVRVELWISVEA